MKDFKDITEIYKEVLGYEPDLENPVTFNEKIQYKKLNDRDPLLPLTADKYRVRDYIKEKIGEADDYLIPLLYVTDKPKTIPFNDLPKPYILKANHGCGWNIIVRDEFDKDKIIHRLSKWVKAKFGQEHFEWLYSQIKPLIVAEKLITDDRGNLPNDVRFFMFGGKCRIIMVTTDRFKDKKFTFYSPKWNKLKLKRAGFDTDRVSKPKQLDKMIEFAEVLSEPFDMVRIDFLVSGDDFYFSEITHYPTSGLAKFEPESYDGKLGGYWKNIQ
jgi:hypothetical protein